MATLISLVFLFLAIAFVVAGITTKRKVFYGLAVVSALLFVALFILITLVLGSM